MKKPRILVVGSLVMDMIFRAKRFVAPGETILGYDFTTASGGKGANQAVQAARLGADVTLVGKIGSDANGQTMIASLREAGVHAKKVIVTDTCASGVSNIQIQTDEHGTQNRILVVPGANHSFLPRDVAFLEEEIVGFDMVVLQLEIPMVINELVARYASAKGVPILLNPAPSDGLSDDLLARLDYIIPNEHEAEDLTGIRPQDERSARAAADALLQRGVKNVIITLGEAGAFYCDGKRSFLCPAISCPRPADPTAAGDSFIGAFSTATCAGMDTADAMTFANQTASISVSRMGAQPSLPALREVNAALAAAGRKTLVY